MTPKFDGTHGSTTILDRLTAVIPTIEEVDDVFLAVNESKEIAEERAHVWHAMAIVQDSIQSNYTDPAVLKHTD
ncbi:hypothetical protein DdX_21088 [Ditylenchus destructor]|uniref:Uncharacterized protein n=1 Tax=Ditylenchus destructor TaxID=166010 RepID=A0AAD4QRJ5_9BILA|nr:hypothetical protein DdX_21088 [Ditylenchus destructor]